jgi:hypothetical protein
MNRRRMHQLDNKWQVVYHGDYIKPGIPGMNSYRERSKKHSYRGWEISIAHVDNDLALQSYGWMGANKLPFSRADTWMGGDLSDIPFEGRKHFILLLLDRAEELCRIMNNEEKRREIKGIE